MTDARGMTATQPLTLQAAATRGYLVHHRVCPKSLADDGALTVGVADNSLLAALIEVLVAIVLLATAGIGLVTLLGQTSRSMRTTLESERLVRRASEELDWLVLLDRLALLSRAGRSHARGWTMDVQPLGQGLFAVKIAESDTSRVLLATTLYRPLPDSSNVAR
jgi:hypothetical protein